MLIDHIELVEIGEEMRRPKDVHLDGFRIDQYEISYKP